MNGIRGINRRGFLKASATSAAGLVIGFYLPDRSMLALAQEDAAPRTPKLPSPNSFLRIGSDETITVLLAHSEMGQGIWTGLPILVAEELECDWSKIRVEHAPAGPAYAHTAFGMQMTGGSTTTWSEFDRYRQVGALAREMLIQAAAKQWGVDPRSCRASNGFVTHGSEKLSYGKLAVAAQALTPPASVKLKAAKEWKRIGKPTNRLDSLEKTTGRAQFGMDVRFPGLTTALVARAPVFGGKVKSFNAEKAKALPGVKAVVQVPSGVAVVAEHFWAAKLGRDALEIDWDLGPAAALDTGRMQKEFRALSRSPGLKAAGAGDVEAALRTATSKLEAEYEVPYLAHATMEPLNCTVRLADNECEIWTGTQFQTVDQAAAAKIAGLDPTQVTIHTTFLGGGFGRRANPASDFVREAVEVAKAAKMPVKVVWTREDDMRGGYYRPMWFHRLSVGLDAKGLPVAWRQTIVGQSLLEGTPFAPMMIKDGVDATSVEGAADSPYVKGTASHLVDLHSPKPGIPVLWWRSVGHSHTAFVMESFLDELAGAAKRDPLEYRRQLLKAHPRHLGVLNLAAQKAGWGKPLAKGHFRGIAVHESFGSFIAQVAEVSVEDGQVRVHRVVCAVDCGVCVNPASVAAQMDSGVVYGLSAALYGELRFKEGRVQQSNFHDYPLLRLQEMPRVETHVVHSSEKPGGVGEPGVAPIAPAVANAIFAATGKRLRRLPLRLGESA
jgi:isoquinoline 1-oxidoreductase beta subunit